MIDISERKKEPWWKNYSTVILTGFAFFAVEYIIKNLAVYSLRSDMPILGNWFRLVFVPNHTMALSIPMHQSVIVLLSGLVILGLVQYFTICVRDGQYAQLWAVNFIIWAAFSNFFDRITRGYVVDYVDIGFFPVFNLADVVIVVGFIALLYTMARSEREKILTLSEA